MSVPLDLRRRNPADRPECLAHGARCPRRDGEPGIDQVRALLDRSGAGAGVRVGRCQMETGGQVQARHDRVADLLERSRRVRAGQGGAA